MNIRTLSIDGIDLTRVGYADVTVPPEVVGLSARDIARVTWSSPLWADGGQARVGAAAWFADVDGRRLAFDPVQSSDAFLRADLAAEAAHQSAVANTFAEGGFPRESVDMLVMTHIEGVGMVAWRNADGSWSPFFPNARVLVSDAMLHAFGAANARADGDIEREAWQALIDQGCVHTYRDGEEIAPGIRADVTGAHCPGHAALHFGGRPGAPVLSMVGHLAVSPMHLATGECASLHADPAAAVAALHSIADDGRILVGPLWPAPGYGRWLNDGLVAESGPGS